MTNEERKITETGRPASAMVLAVIGLGAAFGAASCCAIPLLLGAAGLSSAWFATMSSLAAPHRVTLLLLGAAALVSGGYFLFRQRKNATCNALCRHPAFRGSVIGLLLLGAVLLYLGYAYA